jgi:hypothetical protein
VQLLEKLLWIMLVLSLLLLLFLFLLLQVDDTCAVSAFSVVISSSGFD